MRVSRIIEMPTFLIGLTVMFLRKGLTGQQQLAEELQDICKLFANLLQHGRRIVK